MPGDVAAMKQVDCRGFRADIVHFQADELPAERRSALQEHLTACEDCARRLEVEDGLLRALRARLPRHRAPESLNARVRGVLRRERPAGAGRWLRPSALLAAAASLALAALIVGELRRGPSDGWRTVERTVTVVDRDCDREGKSVDEQRDCRDPMHLNALEIEDGSYWSVSLDNDDGRRIVADPRLRGHVLRVQGDFFGRIRTLRLDRVRDMGLVTLRSALGLPLLPLGAAGLS